MKTRNPKFEYRRKYEIRMNQINERVNRNDFDSNFGDSDFLRISIFGFRI
jgi:hypothetical protein